MSDYLKAPVVGGEAVTGTSETYQGNKSKGDSLGKDAFLQLLVAQMQNQDPMKPTDNTQMVSELAQFTTIEELQNLGSTFENSNAFNLVGKNVIVEVGKSSGATTTTTVGGYVQFVQIIDGKAMLSIGDKLYEYADLDMVIDEEYLDSVLNPKPDDGDDTVTDGEGDGEDTETKPPVDGDNTEETPDGDGSTEV